MFLDPKGLARFGADERRKVRLHSEIAEIEERVREVDPSLHMHAYVLSVTPPDRVGDESRTQEEWEELGVFFLDDSGWPQRLLADVLGDAPETRNARA